LTKSIIDSEVFLDPFATKHQVQITKSAVRRIRRGHLWIYAGEVAREPDGNPAIVQVIDEHSNVIGYAFYSAKSQIRLRLFSRDPAPPTQQLIRTRFELAVARRSNFGQESACRLVFGEGDLLPAIIVDRYRDCLVLQTLSSGTDTLKPIIVEILNDLLHPAGILERNDVRARRLEGLEETKSVLSGAVPSDIEIVEDGTRFLVDMQGGQKTGFFLDQSQNRIAARKHATGRALDCFTNTGAFALQFARNCESVLAVDISPDSVQLAQQNCALNKFDNVKFETGNVFDFLRELEISGQSFDTICLDPPAFAKNRKALPGARSGYKEINLRAMKLLRPEGILITSSCSYHMLETDFFDILCEAAHDTHRYIQVIERRGQATDHPALAGMPETCYLKCFFLRVL
jgi:23S rRNA (cytosine1962-C5)-methyltransferase